MPDYQLERLNTRSFEQLIRSFVSAVMGHRALLYGDGADGGREATFIGKVHCPPLKEAWDGSLIVQAKFRQLPDSSPAKNATWLIEQLRAEFEHFVPRPGRKANVKPGVRYCPDYYVLATNVSLSGVRGSGGKDRVVAVLEDLKRTHKLRDYAIWDREQIAALLDQHPGIRTTYTAFLLPDDVLAALVEQLGLAKTHLRATLQRYLEVELLEDQFAALTQGGYTDARAVPISQVFVDLPVKQSETDTFLGLMIEESREVLRATALEETVPSGIVSHWHPRKPLRVTESVRPVGVGNWQGVVYSLPNIQRGRVVLVGGPGQGKTTLCQYLCQLLRAALLRASGRRFGPEVAQALDQIRTMSADLQVHALRYPLRVDLKQLAAALAAPATNVRSLLDFLVDRINHQTSSSLRAEELRQCLRAYSWLLVLDGLDEVPASSNRAAVLKAIRDFVNVEAHAADADLLVVATTRPQGYSDELNPTLYRHLELTPLDQQQALTYGTRLATARHPHQPTRVTALCQSLERATANAATSRLMQSPLQVTIMLALIESGGEPPEHRWKLFRDYYDVIYRREKERNTDYSSILRSYEPEVHWIHHRAGWELQQRNAEAGETDATLTHAEFEALVDARLCASGHEDANRRRKLVEQIRIAATDRLVFLAGNTAKGIGFELRSLQEFTAAEHFFDGGERCAHESLHAIAPFPYWRNVFLFAAGRVFFERRELIDSVLAICTTLNERADDPAHEMILSGSRLALAILRDGAATHQPAWVRALARCASRCLDTYDLDIKDLLLEVFTGDAEEVLRGELLKRLESPDRLVRCQSWVLALKLHDRGREWLRVELDEHFPWRDEALASWYVYSSRGRLPDSVLARLVADHDQLSLDTLYAWRSSHPDHYREIAGSAASALFGTPTGDSWRLLIEQDDVMELAISGTYQVEQWRQLALPPPGAPIHPDWRLVGIVATWARDPTLAHFVEQLERAAELYPHRVSISDAVLSSAYWPWQFSLCLTARNDGLPWAEIIERVRAGHIGNERDWHDINTRAHVALSLQQFRSRPDFAVSADYLGPVLRNASVGANRTWIEITHIEAITRALHAWPDLRTQSTLLALGGLRPEADEEESASARAAAVRELFIACLEHDAALPVELVATVVDLSRGPHRLELLARAGRARFVHQTEVSGLGTVENASLGDVIADLAGFPQRSHVLRTLAHLPLREAMMLIPAPWLDDMETTGDPALSAAAAILRVARTDWPIEQSVDLATRVLAASKDYPNRLIELFDLIETYGGGGAHLERWAIELVRQMSGTRDHRTLAGAFELLVELVERRELAGQLPDPARKSQA